ncbi:Up-regulated during skeletal muscle growth protein 5 [Penaeus vannamei]|uniref:Up-regulated during skeletal muscle growth protein 5 n=1 Tax=Penaeus vannamei TaxID=6689 RepID=A0A423TXR0_PENVA|nr:Up-regulated during skeletal muscle growth protein 5 [Penaeus vannamei]
MSQCISKLYNLTPDWAVVKPRPIRSRVPSVCVVLPSQLISSQTTGTDHRLKMAGDAGVDSSQFKGMARYFNSSTMTGRANVAKATYAVLGLIIAYNVLKPSKK